MKHLCAALLAALIPLCTSAAAQDVTLSARDGGLSVSGSLLSFDGEFYRVESEFGELTLDGTGVTCSGPGCPNLEDYVAKLTIAGDAMLGSTLMPLLLESYASQQGLSLRRIVSDDRNFHYVLWDTESGTPQAEFSFHLGSTAQGFADLFTDQADIIMAVREVSSQELATAHEAGLSGLKSASRGRVVALDGLVALVSPGTAVHGVSVAQLAEIRAGELTNWAELGGVDAPIILHALSNQHGVEQAVSAQLGVVGPVAVTRHQSIESLSDAVARDPYALGFGTAASVGNAAMLPLVGACGRGFAADATSLKAEDYPLPLPLFLYTPPRRLPKIARGFLRYIRSADAQGLVQQAGFVDQSTEEQPLWAQGNRLAAAIKAAGPETDLADLQRLVTTLEPLNRLSLSFRFEPGSSLLDAQSRSNVLLLAEALEKGVYDGRKLVFAGFSDGDGAAGANLRIAETRARRVRDSVRRSATAWREADTPLNIAAFGEAMPMACDDSDWGRRINRRVEVWVGPAD